jgi:hypothetical protein
MDSGFVLVSCYEVSVRRLPKPIPAKARHISPAVGCQCAVILMNSSSSDFELRSGSSSADSEMTEIERYQRRAHRHRGESMPRREPRKSSARSGPMPSHRTKLHAAWGRARLYALNHDAHGVRDVLCIARV